MKNTATAIGLNKKGAEKRHLRLGLSGFYLIGLWSTYIIALAFLGRDSIYMAHPLQIQAALVVVILYAVNRGLRRFADEQTLYLLVFCSFSLITIQQQNWFLFPFLWIALSPMPKVLEFSDEVGNKNLIWQVPIRKPYKSEPLKKFFFELSEQINEHDRILFDYSYDSYQYTDFEGLRAIKEYLHYLVLKKKAQIVPDYYLVFQSYNGDFPLNELYKHPSPHGRLKAMNTIGARFIRFQSTSPSLTEEWRDAGFILQMCLNLAEGEKQGLWSCNAYNTDKPYLLLLETDGQNPSLTLAGELIQLGPNRLKIRLDRNGSGVLKFLYSSGWHSSTPIVIEPYPGTIPWIQVKGLPFDIVEMVFDYYSPTNRSL